MYTGLPSGHGHDGEKNHWRAICDLGEDSAPKGQRRRKRGRARWDLWRARAPVPLSPAQGPEAELETLGPLNIELRLTISARGLGLVSGVFGCTICFILVLGGVGS